MIRRLARLLLTGLALTPPAAAAVWAWWQRGVPRTPGDAATWTPRHEGPLDATGLHADAVEANLRRLRGWTQPNSPSGRFIEAKRGGDVMRGAHREN